MPLLRYSTGPGKSASSPMNETAVAAAAAIRKLMRTVMCFSNVTSSMESILESSGFLLIARKSHWLGGVEP